MMSALAVSTDEMLAIMMLRARKATPERPADLRNRPLPTTTAPGLIETAGHLAWLTADGWELAERMLEAAEEQRLLFERERAEAAQAERRLVA